MFKKLFQSVSSLTILSSAKETQSIFDTSLDISNELRYKFEKIPFSVLPYFTFFLRIHPATRGALEDIRELFHI